MNPEKPAASTGEAAINIDGTTSKTVLAIPKNTPDVLHVAAICVRPEKNKNEITTV